MNPGKEKIRIAVGELIDSLEHSGDLSPAFSGTGRAVEGIQGHQAVQGLRPEGYQSEVPFAHEVETDLFLLEITGRIDGLLRTPEGLLVEEIKTTHQALDHPDLGENPFHWAQLKIYAYICASRENLAEIDVRLTYYQLDTRETREFSLHLFKADLEDFFRDTVARFVERLESLAAWRRVRDESIETLEFPYTDFRPGQRQMAVEVFRTVRDGGQSIIQAPTGIGKTMAVIFPTLKALPEQGATKVFFLTARTTGRTVAEKAVDELREKGLRLKSLTLTAKEKICFQEKPACTPEECEYARGYYDRIETALRELSFHDAFTRPLVEELARKHKVCPFEYSLDLSLVADFIICDYNYAFDPRVYLRRMFLEDQGDYIFLIDEAHNLVPRAREMFSAELFKQEFLNQRRPLKNVLPNLYQALGDVNAWFLEKRKLCESRNDFVAEEERPKDLDPLLKKFVTPADRWLSRNTKAPFREGLQDLFFAVRSFLRISECYNESYVTCYERMGRDLKVKLFCMDPAANLANALKRCRSALFFSATMTPLHYFRKILGCNESAGTLTFASPFPEENLCILLADNISTLYRRRDRTREDVASMIASIASRKKGNYLFFFPSYQYMNMIHESFTAQNPETETILQVPSMSEKEREIFLARFSRDNSTTLVGFAVMGGIFGEGIDLVGDRLTGAVIVGVGLPAICSENELIRQYFARTGRSGFEYAYVFPGINRVLQAAGRVIRTEADRGVVLLVDERFSTPQYRSLLPDYWRPIRVQTPEDLEPILCHFWTPELPEDDEAPGSKV